MLRSISSVWLLGWVVMQGSCGGTPSPMDAGDPDPDTNAPLSDPFVEDQNPAVAALEFVADELLVQPLPGADAQSLDGLYTQVGATVRDRLDEIETTVLAVDPAQLASAASTLWDSGLFESIQKNYLFPPEAVPNDPFFDRQTSLSQIGLPAAWDITVGSESVIIAIVDTGVDPDHPDLASKIAGGWNAYDSNDNYADVHGHGTAVAGVAAAASNNATGVAGVSWLSPILAIRATDTQGRASARHLAAAILWAVGHDASVINLSFAPLHTNRLVRSAAQTAFNRGALVVVSAGNDGLTYEESGSWEVLFVGAVSGSDQIASFSTRGPFVDLVAPGIAIRTTKRDGDTQLISGTSFAAPIVAGLAALTWSANPDLRPSSVVSTLTGYAVDLGEAGWDRTYGAGRVRAVESLQYAMSITELEDLTAPTVTLLEPAAGAVLSKPVVARVDAADDYGVADVVLSIDGLAHATDPRWPYELLVDPARFSAGVHTLTFVATDLAGNASAPASISVTFAASGGTGTSGGGTPATISFTSPKAGSTVSGEVTIRATVADPDELNTLEWLIGGEQVLLSRVSGKSVSTTYVWRTTGLVPGSYTIAIVATDVSGNATTGTLSLVVK